MTIHQILEKEIIRLKQDNITEPIFKARILLAFIINKNKEYLVINQNKELTIDEQRNFENAINRLLKGEPLQHITGKQEFMKLNFTVNKNVLIPRSDTEILVEEVIEILKRMKQPKVLDLCTGSGAIAVSIAKYLEHIQILATDISEKALEIAEQNAKKLIGNNILGVLPKIKFLQSDLFENIKGKFNLIVSNPPYIEKEEMKKLEKEVQNEPRVALYGGEDGLDYYKKIILEVHRYLKPKGYLCLEIGYNQKEKVMDLIKNSGKYDNIYSKKDLAGNDRVIVSKLK